MESKLGLAICCNYITELECVVNELSDANIQTFCLHTTCLNQSQTEKIKISEQIKNFREQVDNLNILIPESCAGCPNTSCKKNCASCDYGISCLELFAPKNYISQLIEEGYYIVTPGWLSQWKTIVQETWKVSEQYSKEFFRNTARQICVLDTGVHANYKKYLDEFSRFSGLKYKVANIGIDFFRMKVEKIVNNWALKKETDKIKEAYKKVADYTMALEIIKSLSSQSSEKELLHNIFQLFILLFSPQRMQYTPIHEGEAGHLENYSLSDFLYTGISAKKSDAPDYELLDSRKGFRINASYNGEILGLIEVDDILFTEHLNSYIALTNSISSVLGLLIYNSRQYGKVLKEKIEILSKSEHDLRLKNEELRALYMELQASEEEIRSSNEELRVTAEELWAMNKELEKAKQKAEESDRLKTAFLHNTSHEIRTPLNAILGFSEILSSNFDDKEKLAHFSEIIRKRGQDLLRIVDEILDIAKIESNQMQIRIGECNLSVLLAEIEEFYSEYQKQINKSHISFKSNIPNKDTGLIIKTDSVKLKQIFINLINNAFKFTNQGEIEFGIDKEENNFLIFYVKDTGIGIPKEKDEIIFQRFMQVNTDSTRIYGGTGLGLSIVKGLIDLLKGDIWLESEQGKGSTFYFSIPTDHATHKSYEPLGVSEQQSILKSNSRILIVEDDSYNTEYLKEVLILVKLRNSAHNIWEGSDKHICQP